MNIPIRFVDFLGENALLFLQRFFIYFLTGMAFPKGDVEMYHSRI
jgi:hypothetical protein